jgi:glycosyltransferase involved in cell wall biosynthesis
LSQDSSEALREELEKVSAELRNARLELARSRERVAAMEMSFFWKLRNAWWAVKGFFRRLDSARGVPLPDREIVWSAPADAPPPDSDPTGGRFAGRRVLILLPVAERGGGANVVLREAASMRAMGVDARIVNLRTFEPSFRAAYPKPAVPVAFAAPAEIPALARGFDAVVATANRSVEWLVPLARTPGGPVPGYYVQDFEPYFYDEGSPGHAHALASYTLLPNLVRFAKTEWNAREVTTRCGVSCAVVGPSLDTTLFRPLTGRRPAAPPVHIVAMIRPSSPRRQPEFTLRVFERIHERFGDGVVFSLFGVDAADPEFRRMPKSFPYRLLGIVTDLELADLFNEAHVFTDFSSYQAMGLTAMEAMACGAAAIVPQAGGATSFAVDGRNALVVDTCRFDACVESLARLVDDRALTVRLGEAARQEIGAFRPERAAARILECLFPGPPVRLVSGRVP